MDQESFRAVLSAESRRKLSPSGDCRSITPNPRIRPPSLPAFATISTFERR